jgi:hypothetical protein
MMIPGASSYVARALDPRVYETELRERKRWTEREREREREMEKPT